MTPDQFRQEIKKGLPEYYPVEDAEWVIDLFISASGREQFNPMDLSECRALLTSHGEKYELLPATPEAIHDDIEAWGDDDEENDTDSNESDPTDTVECPTFDVPPFLEQVEEIRFQLFGERLPPFPDQYRGGIQWFTDHGAVEIIDRNEEENENPFQICEGEEIIYINPPDSEHLVTCSIENESDLQPLLDLCNKTGPHYGIESPEMIRYFLTGNGADSIPLCSMPDIDPITQSDHSILFSVNIRTPHLTMEDATNLVKWLKQETTRLREETRSPFLTLKEDERILVYLVKQLGGIPGKGEGRMRFWTKLAEAYYQRTGIRIKPRSMGMKWHRLYRENKDVVDMLLSGRNKRRDGDDQGD
jgi:hypothetical protein